MINSIVEKVKKSLHKSRGSHDWEHTLRVYNLAVHIAKKTKANLEIVKIAALLHDVARMHEDKSSGRVCHAEKGASLAKNILTKLKVDEEKIKKVAHCIETHRFRGNKKPKTTEAKVIFDADKLDSIGAVGIGRAFLFAGELGAKLHNKGIDISKTKAYTKEDTAYREFMVKLRYVKNRMLTKEGKRLAKKRHKFMVEYFNRLNKEVVGMI